ncbi:MAG: hypothetical protein M1840_006009 [Geoglossum simile]|nr:MAG: hypothetical protein M1840_006009 [Geoglossum simile]
MLVSSRDVTCRITGYSSGTKVCHLCPKSEVQWFNRNDMRLYNIKPNLRARTDDMSNAMLIRRDLHFELDSRVFVIVPKGPTIGFQLLAIGGVTPQFLFARFAWAIFPAVSAFVQQGPKRHVTCIRAGDDNATETLWKELDEPKPTKRSRQSRGSRPDTMVEEGGSLGSIPPEELEALEASEMGQDLSAMKKRFPDFPPFNSTDYQSSEAMHEQDQQALDATWGNISWYPGHRHVARLKEKWLKERRHIMMRTSGMGR